MLTCGCSTRAAASDGSAATGGEHAGDVWVEGAEMQCRRGAGVVCKHGSLHETSNTCRRLTVAGVALGSGQDEC